MKKYRHRMNSTACAIEFKKMVGRICKSTPTVYVNFMDEWIGGAGATRLGGLRKLEA